ncbi:hypothetical protein BDR26DRAFT_347479 [Obelidium mucronatum]|nr:hypothetical protein BDR26DRAFT_347479 [Obelidium mucronatum]
MRLGEQDAINGMMWGKVTPNNTCVKKLPKRHDVARDPQIRARKLNLKKLVTNTDETENCFQDDPGFECDETSGGSTNGKELYVAHNESDVDESDDDNSDDDGSNDDFEHGDSEPNDSKLVGSDTDDSCDSDSVKLPQRVTKRRNVVIDSSSSDNESDVGTSVRHSDSGNETDKENQVANEGQQLHQMACTCGEVFEHKDDLIRHSEQAKTLNKKSKTKSGEKTIEHIRVCTCGWQFEKLYDLHMHVKGLTNPKSFRCDIDGCLSNGFAGESELRRHKKQIHDILFHPVEKATKITCEICGAGFLDAKGLFEHFKRFEQPVKPAKATQRKNTANWLKCPTCDTRKKRQSDLLMHIKHHDKSLLVSCLDKNCNDKVPARDLQKHTGTKHRKEQRKQPKDIQCAKCLKYVSNITRLKTHQQSKGCKPNAQQRNT